VTEHTIWRDYCPRCKKDVEPVVGDAWSKATFGHRLVCYYLIDRGRGSPVLKKFFDTVFEGVLLPDFWVAYNAVEAAVRQCCHAHLLRELEKTDLQNDSEGWQAFGKVWRRLIRDAIRLRKRPDFSPPRYARRIERIENRLAHRLDRDGPDPDVRRLLKRLRRHQGDLFTSLHRLDVPYGRVGTWQRSRAALESLMLRNVIGRAQSATRISGRTRL